MLSKGHQFAIFYALHENIKKSDLIKISDELIYHRLIRVLRLELNDSIVLFNDLLNIECIITQIEKKHLILKVTSINNNTALEPKITMCLSLLKREAFEESVYACVEIGANIIQPVITQKTHQKLLDHKELTRLKKIVISAREQSKNFKDIEIKESINFEKLILQIPKNSTKIFFDHAGEQVWKVLSNLKSTEIKDFYLLIGPEGDLNDLEKDILKRSGFIFCSLTPTILRAQMAINVGLGIFRSVLKK